MRKTTSAWILVGVLVSACGFLGFKWLAVKTQLRNAQAYITELTTIPDDIDTFQSAVFVHADERTITYRVTRTDTVDGQSFINYDERTASYNPSQVRLLGILAGNAGNPLPALADGTAISIVLSPDGTSIYQVYIPVQQ